MSDDLLFVPGRLCLFGEHSDWAGGYRAGHPAIDPGHCLVAGTDQGLRTSFEPIEGALEIASALSDGARVGPERIALDGAALAAACAGRGFFSYAAGTWAVLRERFAALGCGGLRLEIRSTLPVRKGLSSSAAVCVLVARAASRAYGLGLSVEQEMEIAYAGERRAGSECGRMDQICAFGRGPVAMHIDGDALRFAEIPCGGRFDLLIVDLRRTKDTRRILADLNACFPDAPGAVARGVREALGAHNREVLARAERCIADGDAPALGALMDEAQRAFDAKIAPACPELAAPRLHEVLAHPAVRELGHGGKGVGSQGDGSAQIVARGPDERDALARALAAAFDVGCLALTLGAR